MTSSFRTAVALAALIIAVPAIAGQPESTLSDAPAIDLKSRPQPPAWPEQPDRFPEPAQSDQFPKIDIEKVCKKNTETAYLPLRALADCMEVQTRIRGILQQHWGVIPTEVKSYCMKNLETYWWLQNCIKSQIGDFE
jgi:hypothetical protein